MIIVHGLTGAGEASGWQVALVFGVGLIGSSVVAVLRRELDGFVRHVPYSWGNGRKVEPQSEAGGALVESAVADLVDQSLDKPPSRIAVIWSAGGNGFGASKADMAAELSELGKVLTLADRLFASYPTAHQSFHMLSSAGGLFEGQTNVDQASRPRPLRPYGWGKLEQEQAFGAWHTSATKICYRPSSVYGFSPGGQPKGLISALLLNGLRHKVTHFFGRSDTLRDYVAGSDVGQFVAEKVLHAEHSEGPHVLVAARPTTLFELTAIVERILGRKIYVQFEANLDNSANNSYRPSVRPQAWRPVDVETGSREIYAKYLLS